MTIIHNDQGELIFSTERNTVIRKGFVITYKRGERALIYELMNPSICWGLADTVTAAIEKIDAALTLTS